MPFVETEWQQSAFNNISVPVVRQAHLGMIPDIHADDVDVNMGQRSAWVVIMEMHDRPTPWVVAMREREQPVPAKLDHHVHLRHAAYYYWISVL